MPSSKLKRFLYHVSPHVIPSRVYREAETIRLASISTFFPDQRLHFSSLFLNSCRGTYPR